MPATALATSLQDADPRIDVVGATPPPAVLFDPMELVRAAHEAAAEQALHRSRTFLHQVFQQLSEAEADLLIAAEASFMEHSDLGQALRGPLSNLETALRDHLERHRRQEAEASREALHALASQLSAQYDEQMQKQAEVLGFSEKAPPRHTSMAPHRHATLPRHTSMAPSDLLLLCNALHPAYTSTLTAQHAEAKLKAARVAAQTRLVEARTVLERQCEARLAKAAQQAAAQLEAVRAAARPEAEVGLAPQLGLVELLEGQARPRARMGLGLG